MSWQEPGIPVAISYSGGSSSEWIVRSVINGTLPRPEQLAVFFADTGWEHDWTYEAVDEVKEACRKAGIPFFRCGRPETLPEHLISINRDGLTRGDTPPLYIKKDGGGAGKLPNKCTRQYKIRPMRQAQSRWLKTLGQPKRVMKWIGFGIDEAGRAQKALGRQDVQWEHLDFPAMRLGLKRGEQRAQLERETGRAPRFSMCTGCPHKTVDRWKQTPKRHLPLVYETDEAIRDLSGADVLEGDTFLSDRLIPVEHLLKHGDPTPLLPGLASYCDGGACFL